jgi:hypothetical protein
MPNYPNSELIYNLIIQEASEKDIVMSLMNHYGHGGGLDGIEAQLTENYVLDLITLILDDMTVEQKGEIAIEVLKRDEFSVDNYTLEELAVSLQSLFSVWMDDNFDMYGNRREEEEVEIAWKLNAVDLEAIEFGINAAYDLLRKPGICPYNIQGLARAIYALKHLPVFDQDISVTYGLMKKVDSNGFSEKYCFEFSINEDHFKISELWSTYDPESGSDTRSSIIYFNGPNYPQEANDLDYFRNKFYSFLDSSDVVVEDNSDPEVSLEEE